MYNMVRKIFLLCGIKGDIVDGFICDSGMSEYSLYYVNNADFSTPKLALSYFSVTN